MSEVVTVADTYGFYHVPFQPQITPFSSQRIPVRHFILSVPISQVGKLRQRERG